MISIPATLNTREDFDNAHAHALAGHGVSRMRQHWQSLIDSQKHYVFDKTLSATANPTGPEPDYVVRETTLEDGTTERHQFALVDNPNAKIHAIGFSDAEAQAKIAELEAL